VAPVKEIERVRLRGFECVSRATLVFLSLSLLSLHTCGPQGKDLGVRLARARVVALADDL
jgi:hypothetical protein